MPLSLERGRDMQRWEGRNATGRQWGVLGRGTWWGEGRTRWGGQMPHETEERECMPPIMKESNELLRMPNPLPHCLHCRLRKRKRQNVPVPVSLSLSQKW